MRYNKRGKNEKDEDCMDDGVRGARISSGVQEQ
jgi:hypothetical protein